MKCSCCIIISDYQTFLARDAFFELRSLLEVEGWLIIRNKQNKYKAEQIIIMGNIKVYIYINYS